MPAWNEFRRTCHRIRSTSMPKSPKSPAEIVAAYENQTIKENYGMTLAGGGVEPSAFYRKTFANEKFAYCIFASQFICDKVAELDEDRRHFLMDGTFRVVPYGDFKQLLVMHATFFDKTIPFIYALMSQKTEEAYTHLLQYIESEIISLRPTSFMTDYEEAMRNAIRKTYPGTQLYGCWFHFCQAVKRHGSQLRSGFMVAMRNNAESAKLYYELLCLPLLPHQYIINVFNIIKQEARFNHGKLFDEFIDYYERQWLFKKVTHTRAHTHDSISFQFNLFLYADHWANSYFCSGSTDAHYRLSGGLQLPFECALKGARNVL